MPIRLRMGRKPRSADKDSPALESGDEIPASPAAKEPVVVEITNPVDDAERIKPPYDAIIGKYSGMTLDEWLEKNYAKGTRETGDEIVICTGRDFETNMPKLETIPRQVRVRQKRPKYSGNAGGHNSGANAQEPVYIGSSGHGYTAPLNASYMPFADMLAETGELFIRDGQRLNDGKKSGAVQGKNIAKKLKRMLTAYLHANGIDDDVRIDFRNGGAMLTMDPQACAAYRSLRQRDSGKHY